MTTYTLAQAKRNLATLLEKVLEGRAVQIQDAEGNLYVLQRQRKGISPLDVEGVDLGVPLDELLAAARPPAKDA